MHPTTFGLTLREAGSIKMDGIINPFDHTFSLLCLCQDQLIWSENIELHYQSQKQDSSWLPFLHGTAQELLFILQRGAFLEIIKPNLKTGECVQYKNNPIKYKKDKETSPSALLQANIISTLPNHYVVACYNPCYNNHKFVYIDKSTLQSISESHNFRLNARTARSKWSERIEYLQHDIKTKTLHIFYSLVGDDHVYCSVIDEAILHRMLK